MRKQFVIGVFHSHYHRRRQAYRRGRGRGEQASAAATYTVSYTLVLRLRIQLVLWYHQINPYLISTSPRADISNASPSLLSILLQRRQMPLERASL